MRALFTPAALVVFFLAGCHRGDTDDSRGDGLDALDLRREFPAAPENGLQYLSPDLVIPAYTEKEFCTFFTYEGPTMGMDFQGMYQSEYGHHATLNGTNADPEEYPDGAVMDCTEPDSLPMTNLDPLFIGGTAVEFSVGDHDAELGLPDGMAVRLPEGQRVILQSHYVNTSPDDILVADAVNVGLVPEDEVETWVGAFVHTNTTFSLPPGESTTITVECTWEDELNLLFLTGHLHEWGSAIKVEHIRGDVTETVYDVPAWDPLYRDAPPYNVYDEGEYTVQPGDVFRTTCTWFNDLDQALDFPSEMCATAMMAYPSKVPLVCEPD